MGSEYADHPSAAAIKAAGPYPGIDEMPAFQFCTRCSEASQMLQLCGCYCCPCGGMVRADDCLRETWQRLQGERDMLARVLRRLRKFRDEAARADREDPTATWPASHADFAEEYRRITADIADTSMTRCACGHWAEDHYPAPDNSAVPCQLCDCDEYGEA